MPVSPVSRWHARVLHGRLEAFAWWREVMRSHPGGVVPLGTAARLLGVSRSRICQLARQNRFTVIDGMPGGGVRDRFVPVDELMRAPTALSRGRPLVTDHYVEERCVRDGPARKAPRPGRWGGRQPAAEPKKFVG